MREDRTEGELVELLPRNLAADSLVVDIIAHLSICAGRKIDEGITRALGNIGQWVDVASVFISLGLPDLAHCRTSHKWCAPSVEPGASDRHNVLVLGNSFVRQCLLSGRHVAYESLDRLLPAVAQDRLLKETPEARSALHVHFHDEGGLSHGVLSLYAFSGTRQWRDEEIRIVTLLSRIFGHVLAQRQAHKAIRRGEEILRELVEHTPMPIAMNDRSGRIEYLNEPFVQVFGYTLDDIPSLDEWWLRAYPDGQYRHKVMRSRQAAIGARARKGKSATPRECRITCKDGTVRLARVLEVSAGAKVLVVLADITERTKAEEALRASESRFRMLFERSPVAICIYAQRLVIYANPTYLRVFGYRSNERFQSRPLLELIAPQSREQVARIMRCREMGLPAPTEYETTGVRKDGSEFPLGIISTQVDLADGPTTIGFFADLTDRNRTQELLLESENLRAVAGMAAGVAHEINNPLAGMVQNAQSLINRLSLDTPANSQAADRHGISLEAVRSFLKERDIFRMLEEIRASGKRASQIIQDMLAFSRGRPPTVDADLRQLLERSLKLVANQEETLNSQGPQHIQVLKEYAFDTPVIRCHQAQIEQALVNLIRNAVQAMARNPADRPRRLVLRTRWQDSLAYIEVEDSGPGMAPDVRRHIFEPFFTTKQVGEGTGLGLFLVYRIVKVNHRGSITLTSCPGRGTCFTICLPVGPAETLL